MAYFKFPSFFPRGQKQKNDASDDRRNSKRFDPDGTTTILVVDDSRTVRFTLEKLLQQSGYKTISADDGESGIRMALEHQPVLVIMDVVMPGINGFQATRHLRSNSVTEKTPIIMISGNAQATEKFWVSKIGANEYMTKPFNRKDLFERIDSILYRPKAA